MSVVLTVFIILASLLMIGIVLVQKSKGGGLASNFASSNQSWEFGKQPTLWKRRHGPLLLLSWF